MSDDYPVYLVDEPADGYIEQYGWVEVTRQTSRPAQAVEWLTREMPPEGERRYRVIGQSHQRRLGFEIEYGGGGGEVFVPDEGRPKCEECKGSGKPPDWSPDYDDPCDECGGTGLKGALYVDGDEPWEHCAPDAEAAVLFWSIELTDDPPEHDPPLPVEVSEHQARMDIDG